MNPAFSRLWDRCLTSLCPCRSRCPFLSRYSSRLTDNHHPCPQGSDVWSLTPPYVWIPESHSQNAVTMLSFCSRKRHKKRRKSFPEKGFSFSCPWKRIQENWSIWCSGIFFPLVILQILTNQCYKTGLGKLNITLSSLSHSDLNKLGFHKQTQGSNTSLRAHSLSPLQES